MSNSKPSIQVQRAALKELLRREEVLANQKVASKPTEADQQKAQELLAAMFRQQREFFFYLDPKQRRRVARCTRRAGKTTGAAIKILITLLLNPRSVSLYVAKTTTVIRDTIWPELRRLVAEFDLPFEFNETNLRMAHKRSSGRAIFRGASDTAQIEKLRGLKLMLAILDESGTFGAEMEKLVVSVIGPGLRDQGGELLLIGTPGYFPEGLFYEASEGLRKNWVRMRWTLQDNPFLSDEAKDYKTILEEEGLTEQDPIFIREWKGEYCLNTNVQMFQYDPAINSYIGPPPDGLVWYLGVDFGWTDANAIVALGFSLFHPEVYIQESWDDAKQTSGQVAVVLQKFIDTYKPKRIIGDTYGLGAQTAGELWADHRIYVEQAEKHEKLKHIEFVNSAFRRGHIKVSRSTGLHVELPRVLWNEQKTNAHNKAKDNIAFAMVYAWRQAAYVAGKTGDRKPLPELPGLEAFPQDELDAKLGLLNSPEVSWWSK